MAKAQRTRPGLISRHNIVLQLDNTVRDIEYCRLENIKFEPDYNSFQFEDGRWVAEHNNFPIDDDNDLDLMIIVTGNPGLRPRISIIIDDNEPVVHPTYEPIGTNGRGFFQLSIPVNQ